MKKRIGRALVVGGGISGIKSSLDLAELGYSVTLVERAPYLGGILSQLDYQFPTDHCGMCKMLPLTNRDAASERCLRKGFFHKNIDIRLSTELDGFEGEPGKYVARLKRSPVGIDQDLCNGCGKCLEVCPVEAPDMFNLGLNRRKAIYLPVPHNYPHIYQIDLEACDRCGECVAVCPTNAIQLPDEQAEPAYSEVEVGAIILSGGTEYYAPDPQKDAYGYYSLPDVVTSREFERLISGSGPNQGKLTRPSNGEPVRSIAWFQCVGSRDIQKNADFCSSVCCMHAIKEARLVKDRHGDDVDAAIFYMDLRTMGKTFQRYRDEASTKYKVNFQRSRAHSVTYDNASHKLSVRYLDENGVITDKQVDMVVLSVGQKPADSAKELAEKSQIPMNSWGFCQAVPFSTVVTGADGVILSGSFAGLKDISESLIQADAAAISAANILRRHGGALAVDETTSSESVEMNMDPPRILAAFCHDGGSDKDGAPFDLLVERFQKDPAVAGLAEFPSSEIDDLINALTPKMNEEKPNRLLIATRFPNMALKHRAKLAGRLGLSPYSIEIADLNGHLNDSLTSDERTENLDRLLRAGLSKLKHQTTQSPDSLSVFQKALVIGGGVAGISAALAIADNGYEVDVIEKSDRLGGMASNIEQTIEGHAVSPFLSELSQRLIDHPLIHAHLNTELVSCAGEAGNFKSVISNPDPDQNVAATLNHGAVIIATGGQEAKTESYGYGKSARIVTQIELEEGLKNQSIKPDQMKSVVMIQCVDSREEPRNYCSRICCVTALKYAQELKKKNPSLSIFILYRDLMTPGFEESYYTEARKNGVVFISYQTSRKPAVDAAGNSLKVSAYDRILDRQVDIEPDLLVLATGLEPNIPINVVSDLRIDLDQDGFFKEAEPKWRPVDSIREGIFSCGVCLSPKNITDSISSGQAAAQRALRILNDDRLFAGKTIARVRDALCSQCERCIDACPYGARSIDPESGSVRVNPIMCQGCGSCAVVCPNSASVLEGFVDQQMFEIIDSELNSLSS